MIDKPKKPHIPEVRFSDEERISGQPDKGKIFNAANAFVQSGVIHFSNVFSKDLIDIIREEYIKRYNKYFQEDLYEDTLPVGNRRIMIPVEISGIFNNTEIYANPLILPFLQLLLSKSFAVSGFGSVLSLPGAEAQHIHRDHPPLFEELEEGKGILPPFAITTVVPLIDMNNETGSTRIYPGTHQVTMNDAQKMPFIEPEAPTGSMILWDNLVYHGGAANKSALVRPILYLNYSRHWFKDSGNYERLNPLIINKEEFEKVPEYLRPLFAWSQPPTPYDLSKIDPDESCPCYSGKLFKECHGQHLHS